MNYIDEKVEEFETKILPEIFNLPEHGRSVRLDPRDAVVVVDWLHIILTEVDRRARVEERGRLAKILDDVTYADGFVGMSEEEWSGAKKMCKITIQDFLTNLTPNQ